MTEEDRRVSSVCVAWLLPKLAAPSILQRFTRVNFCYQGITRLTLLDERNGDVSTIDSQTRRLYGMRTVQLAARSCPIYESGPARQVPGPTWNDLHGGGLG
jgi:hypothetical protein